MPDPAVALERLADLVNADPALVRRGHFLSTTFLGEIGDVAWLVTVAEGRIARVERGPLTTPWTFAVRASVDAWQRFWQPIPEPGWNDIFALVKRGVARIDGDRHPLMANLAYAKAGLAKPRALAKREIEERHGSPGALRTLGGAGGHIGAPHVMEPITGRYVRLPIAGRAHRLYVEEAGEGIPLLCFHTAGSDTRQFRHLMTDDEITRRFRVIAFDMPGHGKSTPPIEWQDEEYRLTARAYMDAILAVVAALRLERPVGLGCSIGGRIVRHLAMERADRFRTLIGLESADWQEPWYDATWFHRPDVHGGEVCAASTPICAAAPARSTPLAARSIC